MSTGNLAHSKGKVFIESRILCAGSAACSFGVVLLLRSSCRLVWEFKNANTSPGRNVATWVDAKARVLSAHHISPYLSLLRTRARKLFSPCLELCAFITLNKPSVSVVNQFINCKLNQPGLSNWILSPAAPCKGNPAQVVMLLTT